VGVRPPRRVGACGACGFGMRYAPSLSALVRACSRVLRRRARSKLVRTARHATPRATASANITRRYRRVRSRDIRLDHGCHLVSARQAYHSSVLLGRTVISPLLARLTHNTCRLHEHPAHAASFVAWSPRARPARGAKHPAQNIRRKAIMQRTIGYLRPPSPAFVSNKRRVTPFDVLQLQLLPLTFYPLSHSSATFSTILLTMVARNTLLALVAASAGALVSAQGSGDGVQSSSLFLPCVANGAPQGRTTTPDSARAGSQTQTPT
jgi:hypothetical protein